jgi:hypothetical protein
VLIVDKPAEPVPELTPDSLAQSFLQDSIHDHADSVLLDTLSQSIPAPEELGLGPAEGEGMFTSVLAGFVDALKARLAIEIEDLSVHVQHPQSGAFILSLKTISFLPSEDKFTEKVLSMSGIEAFLQNEVDTIDDEGQDDDDTESVISTNTVTSPSPSSARSPGSGDHGLSESMMFSRQEAESLYMSAFSQPAARSTYINQDIPSLEEEEEVDPVDSEQPESPASIDKGFRFFYFEEDLVFRVTTAFEPESTDSAVPSTTPKVRPPPVLQSAIPTAHLFLNPQVNLLPSISLISTILSLSPTSASPPPSTTEGDTPGGIEFSWLGGVVIHFGSEDSESIARLADWKLTKHIGENQFSISVGLVTINSATGEQILNLKEDGKMTVLVLPDLFQVSLPEINLRVDLGGLGSLQPLVKAMKQAWQQSLMTSKEEDDFVHTEEVEDEEWNENLIVEKVAPAVGQGRQIQVEIQRFVMDLHSSDDGTIQFAINEINGRITPSSNNTIEFSGATISIPSSPKPLLQIGKSNGISPLIDFISPNHIPRPGFLVNGAQEILDDFLVGDVSRSDDAWGMIRADAANTSKLFVKMRIPRIDILISAAKDIAAVKKVLSKIQKTMMLFVEESVPVEEEGDDQIDLVMEFALDEGKVRVKLDEMDTFQGRWDSVEGTIVKGVAGGETVGVIDVTKIQIDVDSRENPCRILHESIQKVCHSRDFADTRKMTPLRRLD